MKPWYQKLSSLIEEFYHPFFNISTIYSPDRKSSVVKDFVPQDDFQWADQHLEKNCAFCIGRLKESTPEKLRTIRTKNEVKQIVFPGLHVSKEEEILFRRQGNMFEIIPLSYWEEKYNISASQDEKTIIDSLFSVPEQREFLENLIHVKLSKIQQDSSLLNEAQKKIAVQAFFSGFHELVTSGWHHCPKHKDGRLFSSHSMNFEEHRLSYYMVFSSHYDMLQRNPHIKYIVTFQNWLEKAGASFEHWHKQILALDFWGNPLQREYDLYQQNSKIYQDFIEQTSAKLDLLIAENKNAIAYVEIGDKNGMITICSKSKNLSPIDHTLKEQNDMSDLVHAVIQSLGAETSYNEEWFYTPYGAENFKTPWRIIINLRQNTPAGFENITQTNVSSIAPYELAQTIKKNMQKNTNKAPDIRLNPKKIALNYHS